MRLHTSPFDFDLCEGTRQNLMGNTNNNKNLYWGFETYQKSPPLAEASFQNHSLVFQKVSVELLDDIAIAQTSNSQKQSLELEEAIAQTPHTELQSRFMLEHCVWKCYFLLLSNIVAIYI